VARSRRAAQNSTAAPHLDVLPVHLGPLISRRLHRHTPIRPDRVGRRAPHVIGISDITIHLGLKRHRTHHRRRRQSVPHAKDRRPHPHRRRRRRRVPVRRPSRHLPAFRRAGHPPQVPHTSTSSEGSLAGRGRPPLRRPRGPFRRNRSSRARQGPKCTGHLGVVRPVDPGAKLWFCHASATKRTVMSVARKRNSLRVARLTGSRRHEDMPPITPRAPTASHRISHRRLSVGRVKATGLAAWAGRRSWRTARCRSSDGEDVAWGPRCPAVKDWGVTPVRARRKSGCVSHCRNGTSTRRRTEP
jgi:hypothetical protein